MILPIVKYGHPVLRQKGERIEGMTPELAALVEEMKETMYAANGVGLAAQQVGRALQLAVVDVTDVTDRPSRLEWGGAEVAVEDYMPLVLINPELRLPGEAESGPEGCLSFPELYAPIWRPGTIEVTARNEAWEEMTFRCGGLLARAIQHEVDHLNGILFIDRMERGDRERLKPEWEALQAETRQILQREKAAR
jgi:peptide deformylase